MSPLRILILAGLLYILYRLLTGGKNRVEKKSGTSRLASHDILVEDPVCKVCVPKKQAFSLDEDGKTTYFCSDECRKKFIASKGD